MICGVWDMNIKDAYLDSVYNVLNNGELVVKDDNDYIKEVLGNFLKVDKPLNFNNRRINYKNYDCEKLLSDIKDGLFDIKGNPIKSDALYEYVKSFENPSDRGFVYSYPNRLLSYSVGYETFLKLNQFEECKKKLLSHIGSNRAMMVTWNPFTDNRNDDVPCLQTVQFTIRNNKLFVHVYFRSNDVFGGLYSNLFFITYVALKMMGELNKEAINLNLDFGGIYYYCSSLHLYETDVKIAKKMLLSNGIK